MDAFTYNTFTHFVFMQESSVKNVAEKAPIYLLFFV